MARRLLFVVAILMALVQVAYAEDLDVYTGTGSKPNMLLVSDSSDYMFNCIGWNNSNDSNCGNYVN